MPQQNPLDKFVGKDVWVAATISGKDYAFWYRRDSRRPDMVWLIRIVRADMQRDLYVINAVPFNPKVFGGPDPSRKDYYYSYAPIISSDLKDEQICYRSTTQLFQPAYIFTTDDIVECINIYDEDDAT